MSCYMRHMDWLLDELGLEVNKANRKKVDLAIKAHFGFGPETNCPEVWEKVKNLTEEERVELANKLEIK